MEQRPLRLGDIVDDYCPRERRITNHVIAALMGDAIKQTRCSTCDTEHVYKGGRVPSRRKSQDVAALETAVLASVNGTQLVARIDPAQAAKSSDPATEVGRGASAESEMSGSESADAPGLAASDDGADADGAGNQASDALPGGWMGHRTLIRATLPRTEGEPPPVRPIPEFTMHQRQTRGSHGFRNGQGWNDRGRGGGGPRGNFAFSNGHPHERNGNVNGNGENFGNGVGGNGGNPHRNGGNPQGPGNGQGRPNGHRRHRHGKHRRPR
jgi:hypothetical protein